MYKLLLFYFFSIIFHLRTAFDTVNHKILLNKITHVYLWDWLIQRDWTQEKNCLNAWILKKDDAITRKYQWNHRFLWILSKNFGFWTQTNPNNMIGERLSKNSCDWVASVCFYRKKIIHYKRRSKHRWEWGRGWRNKDL